MNEWLTAQQLMDRLCDPNDPEYRLRTFQKLLKDFRDGPPIVLKPEKHYKICPVSDTDATPTHVYSLYHVCAAIQLFRLSNSICKTLYCTDRYAAIAATLANSRTKG